MVGGQPDGRRRHAERGARGLQHGGTVSSCSERGDEQLLVHAQEDASADIASQLRAFREWWEGSPMVGSDMRSAAVVSATIASQAQEASVAVTKEQPVAAERTTAMSSCRACTFPQLRLLHECGKKRKQVVVPQTERVRSSRQRTPTTPTSSNRALASADPSARARASTANRTEAAGSIGTGDNAMAHNHANRTDAPCAVDMDVSSPSDQVRARCCSAETESAPGT